jgi:carboxymethylenebutenolidase
LIFSKKFILLISLLLSLASASLFAHEEKQDNSWWWDQSWWDHGKLEVPQNFDVTVREEEYTSGDIEVPVYIARPKQPGKYPGVYFIHGRAGLSDLIKKHVRRVAARGFVVMAPDLYTGRDISTHPIHHDYAIEDDVNLGLDYMLKLPDVKGNKVCTYSHTRGGYYSLKLAVTKQRQEKDIACYISYYPHWQDPNAPEPLQVYGYAEQADKLKIPTIVFIGDEEQYQRRRVIETAVKHMKAKQRPVQLIIYPGVGRAFDFRPENVRTFADDLAAKDAIQRSARFIHKHLE